MDQKRIDAALSRAETGIRDYLREAREAGRIDRQSHDEALLNTHRNLAKWLTDPDIERISAHAKEGAVAAIEAGRWEDLTNAYRQSVRFGTGGIRGLMALDRASIVRLKEEGVDAPVLKGPNTINDVVFLLTSVGVAKYGKDRTPPLGKVVIGYDSRIGGLRLASLVAGLFLAYDYTVYLFDNPCPYPEVTFAIPHRLVRADAGIFISASHNDYRYNGYKLSCANGSQFDPVERDEMYEKHIATARPAEVRLRSFRDAGAKQLWFLGGDRVVEGFDYAGREADLIDIHKAHREHVRGFLVTADLAQRQKTAKDPLHLAYCAFHGAGRVAVPRLLSEVGFSDVKVITARRLNELDGLFPSFSSEPGREQQPDPGDPRAAEVALSALGEMDPGFLRTMDILVGTDPDADRCGVVVRVPEEQRHIYGGREFTLLPADQMWTLAIWYRLHREIEEHGRVHEADRKFLVMSHTTSDSIALLARKHGIGVVRTWVGFAALAAAVRETWNGKAASFVDLVGGRNAEYRLLCHPFVCDTLGMEGGKRSINIGAMEQSNGFTILGGAPPDGRSLGRGGHVRDKDGTLAGLLLAEIAAWAKENGTGLIGLLDQHIHADPDIGLFVNGYAADPLDGEYPGIEGDRLKLNILRRALGYYQLGLTGDLRIAGLRVTSATIFRTGKYDRIYAPSHDFQFPDEGIRFHFEGRPFDHATVRPSGTGNSLRFHVQLHAVPGRGKVLAEKARLAALAGEVMREIRKLMGAVG